VLPTVPLMGPVSVVQEPLPELLPELLLPELPPDELLPELPPDELPELPPDELPPELLPEPPLPLPPPSPRSKLLFLPEELHAPRLAHSTEMTTDERAVRIARLVSLAPGRVKRQPGANARSSPRNGIVTSWLGGDDRCSCE